MNLPTFRYILLYSLGILLVSSCGSTKKKSNSELVVASHFLVRHAEKVDDSRDPGLTDAGKERAYFLAEHLKDTPLSSIYSTDYFRTRLTAQPSSSLRNMDLILYDAGDLTLFAKKILDTHSSQNVLIAGHSNTTPQLAAHLCPTAEVISIEHWEYDKLFRVDHYADGTCSCTRINYGKSSTEH